MDISPHRLLERAKERAELGDYFGSIHLLEELIETGRAFADAHQLLGLAYHMVGRSERALEAFDLALELNPRYVEAHIHRGIVLSDMGRTAEAELAFTHARDCGGADRGGVQAHHAAKLSNLHAALGEAYFEAGALNQAIEQYQAALRMEPEFHDLRYRLGRLLLDAGRSLEAREELQLAVDARPGSQSSQLALGLACYVSGDAVTARRIWEQLLAENPEDTRASAYMEMLGRGADE
ncbi:tetratricopeptide repeat protein [Gemmatimonadota bacterium]